MYTNNIDGFKEWIVANHNSDKATDAVSWEGKENGRSADAVINTLIVHMNKYAKTYSKAAMHNSNFATQEEFIFLIVLRALGSMSKMELIKKNIQDKPAGMKLIDRLINHGWVNQTDSPVDKRSKLISITQKGIEELDLHMDKIRVATKIVTGRLTDYEKNQLIILLSKLETFHQEIYQKNIAPADLLETVSKEL
ncbi:MarR family winged helix-turn-helix transcriptional regulator [Sphingobacterium rhinopitheci]|uniref:MarR family winged helix-turn-helix transcriptional regulator n=1 Tax=Sphingobacterium rhinopitheci TaxID=2781960 RepID=UPI001F518FCD|nr:winged helix DNA-binding protein [Sphingobacterium rhinopitheci]